MASTINTVTGGERKREEIEAGAEYLRMERVGNANTDAISFVFLDLMIVFFFFLEILMILMEFENNYYVFH